jgi:intraflagellar transport protein 46
MGLGYVAEIDEARQSDPTLLEMQLRAAAKRTIHGGDMMVSSIEHAEQHPAKIEKWIADVDALHRGKPPHKMHYEGAMPDVEALMEQWPAAFEAFLDSSSSSSSSSSDSSDALLPSPDLDLSLAEYAKTLCSILDIPCERPVEALHLMFTLFLDFRNNPHFAARLNEENGGDRGAQGKGAVEAGVDFLEI